MRHLGFGLVHLALVLGGSAAVGPLEHVGQDVSPEPGVLLVSKNEIEGGPFYQSVVLLLAHSDEGTLGLIVNQTTDVPLSDALPELGRGSSHTLYFGGPVGLSGLLYLFRSDKSVDDADRVMGDVYYSGERALLEELIESEKGSDELRLFLGHSGWAPGQLDAELVRGSWDVVRADALTVFTKDPKSMWSELSRDGRVIARSRFLRPPHPSSQNAPAEAP